MSAANIEETNETQFSPGADLFSGDTDLEEDVYRANEVVGDDLSPSLLPKRVTPKTSDLLSLNSFWDGFNSGNYDNPRETKNHFWDFLVYHNLREEREGKYAYNVELLESELTLSIKKAKFCILDELRSDSEGQYSKNSVEVAFDNYVYGLLQRLRIRSLNGKTFFGESKQQSDSSEVNLLALENFIESHHEIVKLKKKIHRFRERKSNLVRSSLNRLLSSVEELRGKVLSQVLEVNSPAFKRFTMTRFLRNLDKISSRSDFFGEYRFSLLKNYVTNKRNLEELIHNNVMFDDDSIGEYFNTFVNALTSGLIAAQKSDVFGVASSDSLLESTDVNTRNGELTQMEEDDTILAVQRIMEDQLTAKDPIEPQEPIHSDLEPDLELLEDARRKAAEILRLKRLQRIKSVSG